MAKVEKDWHEFISQPTYDKTKELKDIFIPMRDGVKLACDIYYPDADGKFPALIAFQAFGKNHEDAGRPRYSAGGAKLAHSIRAWRSIPCHE